MDVEKFPDTITIFGCVAFVLCISEPFLDVLIGDRGHATAVQAFGEAKRWLAGEDVGGDTLADLLHSVDDEGMLIYEQETHDENAKRAYIYLGGALGYVAWQVYERAGEIPDAMLVNFSESAIPQLLEYARDVPTYDEAYVQRVHSYIRSNYRIEGKEKLGTPIDLEDIKKNISRFR